MADLQVRGLRKAFGATPVLRGIDLDVPSGTTLAVLGASGGGKTTLLRLLCGFERADAGSIAIAGRVVADGKALHCPPERRHIGYVAQEGALFPHLSVADNVLFGLPRRQRRQRALAGRLLEQVGLPASFASRSPQDLSGGEQQRVALARALAPQPALVLLDEPFSALDAALRQDTRAAVAGALAQVGATAVLVTHDQAEALSLGARVAVLRNGVLVQVAAPQDLYRRPADPALACFVGEAVLLPGHASGRVVRCALGVLPLAAPASGAVQVLVRPEQVRVVANGAVRGTVGRVIFGGPDAAVTLRLHDAARTVVTARVPGHAMPEPGAELGVAVEGEVVAYSL
jgi:iron(III) transport system ATP-binding protein